MYLYVFVLHWLDSTIYFHHLFTKKYPFLLVEIKIFDSTCSIKKSPVSSLKSLSSSVILNFGFAVPRNLFCCSQLLEFHTSMKIVYNSSQIYQIHNILVCSIIWEMHGHCVRTDITLHRGNHQIVRGFFLDFTLSPDNCGWFHAI